MNTHMNRPKKAVARIATVSAAALALALSAGTVTAASAVATPLGPHAAAKAPVAQSGPIARSDEHHRDGDPDEGTANCIAIWVQFCLG
ncbi:hypothetical protein SSP35_01_01420 [Streptomyces sp. NBRC 110611]|nr:hypothetical protein SSP35_01_01420 [Streptomyces sp. NBRC 110611]